MTEKYYDKIYSSNAKTTKPMLRELMHEAINLLGKRKKKSCLTIVSALQMVPLFLRMTRWQQFLYSLFSNCP